MILPPGVSPSYIPRLEISQEARFCRPSVEPVASLAGICIDSHFYSFRWRSVQHEGRLRSSSAIGEQHFYTGLIDWDLPVVRKTSRQRSAMPLERERAPIRLHRRQEAPRLTSSMSRESIATSSRRFSSRKPDCEKGESPR
ncbi:hypothetical protein JCGZ_19309 [Jatropha curcas]|uniref:Uncharacterized protein n=1 Tax=Jatropha curcas TaxID=180498 RepID=A0A067KDB0_JATCU|nr:hypothetical protein JCGZ_19309 [Jatropha curcas]